MGVAVGIGVNLLVIPPLRDRQAARYVDSINRRMGDVLTSMADAFSSSWETDRSSWETDRAEDWLHETTSMSEDLDSAWQSVRFARESRQSNPRLSGPRRSTERHRMSTRDVGYEEILQRVDEGISHLRHLARTLREAAYAEGAWDEHFRERWTHVVREARAADGSKPRA